MCGTWRSSLEDTNNSRERFGKGKGIKRGLPVPNKRVQVEVGGVYTYTADSR